MGKDKNILTQGDSDTRRDAALKLSDNEFNVLQLKLSNPGIKQIEIAKELGISEDTVYAILKRPRVIRIIEEKKKTAFQIFMDAQPEAARVLIKALKDKDKKIAVDAAKYITKNVLEEKINFRTQIDLDIKQKVQGMTKQDCIDYIRKLTNPTE